MTKRSNSSGKENLARELFRRLLPDVKGKIQKETPEDKIRRKKQEFRNNNVRTGCSVLAVAFQIMGFLVVLLTLALFIYVHFMRV